ncbi:hypothetical protein [Clostridium sp.]|uniref:hypothetical protein n=1 Tax=Clostridium sp. TaxID=1506 RepID=UPI001B0128F4|nr:hypothetical protein [Clostridium sp.]MBO5425084.1 hypothetical protein [Lachnospiraceae bacterium]MBP3917112.1 hypothetical protein [Clostridium sp.]
MYELMTYYSALEMIEKYRSLYPKDWEDIYITHGGKDLFLDSNVRYNLRVLYDELINIKECNRNLPLLFSKVITINKYELLDINTLNIHGIDFVQMSED